MSFHLACVRIIGLVGCGKTRNNYFHENSWGNNLKFKKEYAKNLAKQLVRIKSQYWGGNSHLSIEVISVEYFPNSVDPGNNEINKNFIHI